MNTLVQAQMRGRGSAHMSRIAARWHPGGRSQTAAGLAALAIAAAIPVLSQAAVPPVDPVGKVAILKCGTTATGASVNALHADKIVFVLTGALQARDPVDQAALNQLPRNTELDIKVTDNPKTITDLRGKVLSFIGAVDNPDSRAFVKIISVAYAVVCPVVK